MTYWRLKHLTHIRVKCTAVIFDDVLIEMRKHFE